MIKSIWSLHAALEVSAGLRKFITGVTGVAVIPADAGIQVGGLCGTPAPVTLAGVAKARMIGVGNGFRRPRPPNRAYGSPAHGSPVGGFLIGIGSLTHRGNGVNVKCAAKKH